jgi:hypothetical protein
MIRYAVIPGTTTAATAAAAALLQLHEGPPSLGDAGGEEGLGLLQGGAGSDAGTINAAPLELGLLRDGPEDGHAAAKLQVRFDSHVVGRGSCELQKRHHDVHEEGKAWKRKEPVESFPPALRLLCARAAMFVRVRAHR